MPAFRVKDEVVFRAANAGVLLFLIFGSTEGFADDVVIEHTTTFENLASEEEVSLGRYEFSRLGAGEDSLWLRVDYRSFAGETIRNPAEVDFDFQYSLNSEVILIGRLADEVVFLASSNLYEVEDQFFNVPAGEEVFREFPDERIFQRPIERSDRLAGKEIELFLKIRQTMGEGNAELSTLKGYRAVEISVAFTFLTEIEPIPSPKLEIDSQLVGPGEGVVNFMTRQGFEYHLIWAESFSTPEVVMVVQGTSTDMTFTFDDLEIVSPKGFFWVEEFEVQGSP